MPQYLLGELPPAASDAGDLKPYLGRYIANFATFSNEVFTISERNGRLVLDIPSQVESALHPPRADGRWSLVKSDQTAVSFDRDNTGKVVGLRMHEAGQEFEVPREGVVLTPEIPLSELQKYVGRYGDAAGANDFAILIRNQRLAVRLPNNTSFDLLPPDATGRRATRANVGLGVAFEESQTGAVSAMNFHRPGAAPVMRLTPVASTLPTVDEIMKLRRIPAASAILTMRTTGSIRFPQSAVQGRFSSSTAGDDRLRIDINLDTSLQIRTALNKGRASAAVSGASTRDLTGKMLAQTRLGHPSVLFGDWRKYFDAVRVVRAGALGGRKVYGIQLESAGLPPTLVAVDAETGDVLQDRRTMSFAEAGAMLVTTTYSDYRDIGGMRVPHRYVESNDLIGRTIYEVERVEVGVTLAPEIFTLQALTASGGGRHVIRWRAATIWRTMRRLCPSKRRGGVSCWRPPGTTRTRRVKPSRHSARPTGIRSTPTSAAEVSTRKMRAT